MLLLFLIFICPIILYGILALIGASLDRSTAPEDPLDPECFVALEEDEWD